MVFSVAPQLWDNLLSVLSSLTLWKEVVVQWKVRTLSIMWKKKTNIFSDRH